MKRNIVAGDYVFVYGTLRVGASNSLSGWSGVKHVNETRINGMLYGVCNSYPGVGAVSDTLFSEDAPIVKGDLFLVTDDEAGRGMDRYEGYPSLYDRDLVCCEDGTDAWVYTHNNTSAAPVIESGDWMAHQEHIQNLYNYR